MRILDSDWRSAVSDWQLLSLMPAEHEQHLPQRSCFQLNSMESVNETPLSGLVQARQLLWLGHQLRRPTFDLVQQFCLWKPSQGKQRPGGKWTTYREYIASVFSQEHPPTEAGMRRAVGEREDWRSRVAACGRPWRPSRPRERLRLLHLYI